MPSLAWVRKTLPLTGYTVLAFLFSLAGFLLLMLHPTRPADRLSPYISRLGVVYGPALAALVMASSLRGRPGVHELLRNMLPNRRWIVAPPIIAAGLISTTLAGLICGASPAQLIGTIHAWPLFFEHAALQFFLVGCGEEMGWRGWLLPRLRERHTAGVAAAIVGAIWGVWHLPILLTGLRTAALFLFGVFGLSYLFTALWEHSGRNVFVVAMAHAAVNAPLSWFNEPGVLASVPSETLFETSMAIYGLLGLAFLIAKRRWFFL